MPQDRGGGTIHGERKVGNLPVADGVVLVGVITASGLMNYLVRLMKENPSQAPKARINPSQTVFPVRRLHTRGLSSGDILLSRRPASSGYSVKGHQR